jgi:primosomal replication protein N
VSLDLKALAIGAVTTPLDAMALGATATFAGFVANARNGRGVLFHITSLTPVATSPSQTSEHNEVHDAPTQR